ncbi:hypothetical protein [Nonomuraea sp. NPDC003804]|uniref:hypothetical protein n=1 Tax=Nonomuraea sp. NPDC003804 TaxID=3154547 RepID=UPI0033B7606D
MSLSDVVRNIAKTVTNREELKEKAKELPLFVIQTTLSAAGQALLLADRVKNAVKGLGSNKEDDESERSPVADQPASGVEDEEKPARREPVIFAPRKEKAAERPEPVIFTPSKEGSANGAAVKTAEPTAEPAKTAEPEPAAKTAEPEPAAKTAGSQAASATTTEQAAPAVAEEPVAEQPVAEEPTARQPVAEPVATAVAEPDTAEPKAAEPAAEREAAEPAAKSEVAKSEVAKSDTAEPEAAAPAVQPVSVEEADGELAKAAAATTATAEASVPVEPLAGYADLSVASLRARMRGKSVTQIEELLAYEKATTARPDVVRMYENRLTKLQAAE